MRTLHAPEGLLGSCPPPPWRSVAAGLLTAAMLVVGCAKKAGGPGAPATEAPADAGMAAGADAAAEPAEDGGDWGDALAQAQAELEGYEDALLESGVELPGDVAKARADLGKSSVAAQAGIDGDRCQRRCDLATNICELRTRICSLADDHDQEARYARVCDRATLDCDRATEACEGCEG